MPTRRDFLKTTGAVAGGVLLGTGCASALGRSSSSAESSGRAKKPLRILVLGGTGYIGPHLVRHAIARGHTVTTFTRGRTKTELPPGVEQLIGDRNVKVGDEVQGNYDSLKGRTWDAVIDDSAVLPIWVKQATEVLRPNVTGTYLFVSSTGVYHPYLTTNIDESTRVNMSMDEKDAEPYGVNKSQSEQVVRDAFGPRAIAVRPTYICGPGDPTDRFPYWPVRLARGGEVLAPGKPSDAAQFIDVRDLAEFMIKLTEDGRGGTFNAVGPKEPLTMGHFLEEARAAVPSKTTLTWVDDYDFLAEQKVTFAVPWILARGPYVGTMSINNAKSVAAGLRYRPIATTVRDTLAWWPSVPEARRAKPRFALTPEREAEVLVLWKSRKK